MVALRDMKRPDRAKDMTRESECGLVVSQVERMKHAIENESESENGS